MKGGRSQRKLFHSVIMCHVTEGMSCAEGLRFLLSGIGMTTPVCSFFLFVSFKKKTDKGGYKR